MGRGASSAVESNVTDASSDSATARVAASRCAPWVFVTVKAAVSLGTQSGSCANPSECLWKRSSRTTPESPPKVAGARGG